MKCTDNFHFIKMTSCIWHINLSKNTFWSICLSSFISRSTATVKLPCMSVSTWWDASLRCAMTTPLFKAWAGAVRRFLQWKSILERKSSSICFTRLIHYICITVLCTEIELSNNNMLFLHPLQLGGLPVSRLPWIPVYLWERQTSGRIQEL